MVDCENKVINDIQTAVSTVYNNLAFYGEENIAPSKFPCVVMYQEDNYILENYIDTSGIENYVRMTYLVNVYSNKKAGRKQEAKDICKIISDKMVGLGFRRTMLSPMPNIDITICRYTMRFVGTVCEEQTNKYRVYQ